MPAPWEPRRLPMRKVGFEVLDVEEEERMKAPTPTRTWGGIAFAWEWEGLVVGVEILLSDCRFGCAL